MPATPRSPTCATVARWWWHQRSRPVRWRPHHRFVVHRRRPARHAVAGTAPVEVRVITPGRDGRARRSAGTPVARQCPHAPPVTVVNAPAVKIAGGEPMYIQAGVFADHENASRRVEVLLAAGPGTREPREMSQRPHSASRACWPVRQRRGIRPQHETPARTRHQRRTSAHRLKRNPWLQSLP